MYRLMSLSRWFLLFCALGGSSAHGAKVRIGFNEIAGLMPDAAVVFTGLQQEAARAINARYSAEVGFRGLTHGTDPAMIVVVTSALRYSRAIWKKMVANGDATLEGGLGYFSFKGEGEETPSYFYLGNLYLDQGQSGYLRFWQPGRIKKYMVRVHKDCSVSGSSVVLANPQAVVKSTMLTHTERVGNSFQYHYVVNGGQGTYVSAIWLAYANTGGLFFVTNCQASVYQELEGPAPIPEAPLP